MKMRQNSKNIKKHKLYIKITTQTVAVQHFFPSLFNGSRVGDIIIFIYTFERVFH